MTYNKDHEACWPKGADGEDVARETNTDEGKDELDDADDDEAPGVLGNVLHAGLALCGVLGRDEELRSRLSRCWLGHGWLVADGLVHDGWNVDGPRR